MPIIAAAGDEGDGEKPSAGKGRKGAPRKAKPAKRVGGVLADYLLPDVASVDVESEAGRAHLVMHMHSTAHAALGFTACVCQQVWKDGLAHACKSVDLRSCRGMPASCLHQYMCLQAGARWLPPVLLRLRQSQQAGGCFTCQEAWWRGASSHVPGDPSLGKG